MMLELMRALTKMLQAKTCLFWHHVKAHNDVPWNELADVCVCEKLGCRR